MNNFICLVQKRCSSYLSFDKYVQQKKDTQHKELKAKESDNQLHYELNGTNVNVVNKMNFRIKTKINKNSYIVSPYCGCAP